WVAMTRSCHTQGRQVGELQMQLSEHLSPPEGETIDPTSRLLAASERLMAEAARRFPIAGDPHSRAYWMEAMINQAPDYFFFKDRDSRFLLANHSVISDLYKETDLTGRTDFDLFPPELAQQFFE